MTQTYDRPELDAGLLVIPRVGFLAHDGAGLGYGSDGRAVAIPE